jgi:general secretion pathway protein B
VSFILDALRKSDARRQQSASPGLNSPEPPRPPRPRRRRGLSWAIVGLAIVLVAAASAVYLVRPEWLPPQLAGSDRDQAAPPGAGDSASRPGTDTSPEAGASSPDSADTVAGAGPERVDEPEAAQPDAGARQLSSVPTAPAEEGGEADPGRNRQAAPAASDPDGAVPPPAGRTIRRESAPVPADEAMEELERRLAEQQQRRQEEIDRAAERERSEAAESRPERPSRSRAADQRAADARKPAEPEAPRPLNEGVAEYVRAWELPLAVRRNLPEMKLTIHVFSPNEAERFVLINGERYAPGDSVGEAKIVDISREGAIVDFREHRFLLEPR